MRNARRSGCRLVDAHAERIGGDDGIELPRDESILALVRSRAGSLP